MQAGVVTSRLVDELRVRTTRLFDGSGSQGEAGHLTPDGEGASSGGTLLGGGDQVAAQLEMVVDRAVGGKKSLGMPSGLEPSHVPFAPPGRLMRDFAGFVQISALSVFDADLQILLCWPRRT